MLDKAKVIANATKKFEDYVNFTARSAIVSKVLSGESKAVLEALVEAINNGTDFQAEEKKEESNSENEE